MKYYKRLTLDLVGKYGNRKCEGMICFLYDSRQVAFLPIPVDVEHADFIAKMIGCSKRELREIDISYLIPVILTLNLEGEINGLLVGVSGLEIGYGVRHLLSDLEETLMQALKFVKNGEVPVSKDIKIEVIKKYSIKK